MQSSDASSATLAVRSHDAEAWPELPLAEWSDTLETLRRWVQLVGKTRLALAPYQNHWWHVTLYVTTRGLSTSPMPIGKRTLEIEFDFIDHRLVMQTSAADGREMLLTPRSVADFYREYRETLRSLGVAARIYPVPMELPEAVRFDEDRAHASYDADAAQRCWRTLVQVDRVLKQFRGRFIGKCSPVHFWWGGFDLACTRFSGRPAPAYQGAIPNCPNYVMREAYSHECISAGWWPGGGPVEDAAFYAYSYPVPPDCSSAPVGPSAAQYRTDMGEWILPYEAVRRAADPDAALLEFLQSTYEAAAELAGWDRAALERQPISAAGRGST
jgi:hypothetical protein